MTYRIAVIRAETRRGDVSQQRIALKNPTGWFAAGREVTRAMTLLSDGAFKVYMHVCLTANRSTGRLKVAHRDLAIALKKSQRSVVSYLEELREHQICSVEVALNQHVAGHIEVCDPFWPYVKCRDQDVGQTVASYVESVRQFLAARKCVNQFFNPADERLAAQLLREHVELEQIEHGVLLGCARRYVALLNGTAVGPISGLSYFSVVIQEVRALQISEDYWQHLASRVRKFEQQWVEGKKTTRNPGACRDDPDGFR
jgi:hypothetical protein